MRETDVRTLKNRRRWVPTQDEPGRADLLGGLPLVVQRAMLRLRPELVHVPRLPERCRQKEQELEDHLHQGPEGLRGRVGSHEEIHRHPDLRRVEPGQVGELDGEHDVSREAEETKQLTRSIIIVPSHPPGEPMLIACCQCRRVFFWLFTLPRAFIWGSEKLKQVRH